MKPAAASEMNFIQLPPVVVWPFLLFVLPEVVDVVVVVLDVLIMSSASVSARCTAVVVVVPEVDGRASWIACPRLIPRSTIRVFSSVNGIPRLFETFTAATN